MAESGLVQDGAETLLFKKNLLGLETPRALTMENVITESRRATKYKTERIASARKDESKGDRLGRWPILQVKLVTKNATRAAGCQAYAVAGWLRRTRRTWGVSPLKLSVVLSTRIQSTNTHYLSFTFCTKNTRTGHSRGHVSRPASAATNLQGRTPYSYSSSRVRTEDCLAVRPGGKCCLEGRGAF